MPGRFRNVVLEEGGENRVEPSCEKWSIKQSQGGEEYPAYYKMKEGELDWSHRLLEQVIEGEIEGRQERRRQRLLDQFKESEEYWKLKEEELDRTL